MMDCPLPVEWLEHYEQTALIEGAEQHLRSCTRCQRLVEELQEHSGAPLEPVALPGAERLPVAPTEGAPLAGDIWWTASSYPLKEGLSEPHDRLMVVLVDCFEEGAGWFWNTAPLSTTVEMAHDFDLLFEPEHSTLHMPLRLHGSLGVDLAAEQLDERVGCLVDGMVDELISQLDGGTGTLARGMPLGGPGDPRRRAEHWVAELIGLLERPYRQALQSASEALQEASEAGRHRLQLFWETDDGERQVAFAASVQDAHKRLAVKSEQLGLHAQLEVEVFQEQLLMKVLELREGFHENVSFLINLKTRAEPLISATFTLHLHSTVTLAEQVDISEGEIDTIDVIIGAGGA